MSVNKHGYTRDDTKHHHTGSTTASSIPRINPSYTYVCVCVVFINCSFDIVKHGSLDYFCVTLNRLSSCSLDFWFWFCVR